MRPRLAIGIKAGVAAAAAWLALLPSAAHAQTGTTVSGTLLGVQDELQILTQSDGTRCGVVGGTLRTATGDVTFGAGGVLTAAGTLDPGAQAIVDSLHGAERLGSAAVTTITVVQSTICGYPGNVVTAASVAVTPTPTPTPYPPTGPGGSGPTPEPITRTVTGIVTRMSAFGQLISGAGQCTMWPGVLKTAAGATLRFAVVTPLTGSLAAGGLKPADPNAFPRAKLLQRAYAFGVNGTNVPVTLTLTGPVNACGLTLDAEVTDVKAQLPGEKPQKRKWTGRVTKMSSGRTVSGNGGTCKIWKGTLKATTSQKIKFTVGGKVTNGHVSPNAARVAKTLKQAEKSGRRAQATINYKSSGNLCGNRYSNIVTKAKVRHVRR